MSISTLSSALIAENDRSSELYYLPGICTFRRGERLTLQANWVWQLEKGFVRSLTWDEGGTVVTLGIWGAEDIVGQLFSQIDPYQIECLTTVQARRIVPATVPQLPILQHVYQKETLLTIVHCKRTANRLLMLLNWLAQRFGQRVDLKETSAKADRGWLIEPRLTHQTMAEIIGTTRVTVTRLLRELEQDGKLVRQRNSFILIRDEG